MTLRPKALHPRGSQSQDPPRPTHPSALHSPVWKRDFSTSGGIATTQLKIPATPPATRIRGTLRSLTLQTKQSQTRAVSGTLTAPPAQTAREGPAGAERGGPRPGLPGPAAAPWRRVHALVSNT